MSIRNIPITVNNEYVDGAGVVVGSAGSAKDVALVITFGSPWDGYSKRINWLDSRGGNATLTVLTANLLKAGTTNVYIVPIPSGPKTYQGEMQMTIQGYTLDDDDEIDTIAKSATAYFKVLPSDWVLDDDDSVTPTVAQQLQTEIDDLIDDIAEITGHTEDSEAYAVGTRGGTDVPSTDVTYHNNSKYYSQQSAQSASDAEDSAEDAEDSADSAADSATAASGSASSASEYATAASGYADSALAAKNAAVSAKDDAVTAKNDAVTAKAAAETAEQKIENMTATAQGLAAGASPTVTKTEVGGVVNLDFGIPKGDKGETGATGATGAAATIQVGTVTTGEPGTAATVTNRGTPGAAIFDFTIPKGAKGDAGEGSGDMLASDYDPGSDVINVGGIKNFVAANGGKAVIVTTESTFAEVNAAFESGKTVILKVLTQQTSITAYTHYRLVSYEEDYAYVFTADTTEQIVPQFRWYMIDEEGNWTHGENNLAKSSDLASKANQSDLEALSDEVDDLSDVVDLNTAARHTHGNKALLDTYTQTEANLADAVSKKHSHDNANVLSGIAASDVTNWNNKVDKASGTLSFTLGRDANGLYIEY